MNRCHECGEPPAHEVLAALEAWFKAYPGTIPFLRELSRHPERHARRAAVSDLCTVVEDMHIKNVGTRTRPAVYGGSHGGGGKAERQRRYLNELGARVHVMAREDVEAGQLFTRKMIEKATISLDDIPVFVALGYRRTSRKHGMISRIDRPDWQEFLARKGMLVGPGREGNGADHYRRVYSKDTITLVPLSLALEVPTSGHDPVGFIPKDQLEQQAADAYAAACAECGRMRTTVEVLPVKPRHKHAVTEYHVLLINGVAVIEFENGTELAGKVYKALGTEPPP